MSKMIISNMISFPVAGFSKDYSLKNRRRMQTSSFWCIFFTTQRRLKPKKKGNVAIPLCAIFQSCLLILQMAGQAEITVFVALPQELLAFVLGVMHVVAG